MIVSRYPTQTEVFNNSTKNFGQFPVDTQSNVSVSALVSGSSVAGSLKLQASLNNSNWTDITDSTFAVTTADYFVWNLRNFGSPYLRVVAISSNTNPMTVVVNGYAKE